MEPSNRPFALIVAEDLTDLGDAADEARFERSEIIAFDDWRQACHWLEEETPATASIGPMNHHARRYLREVLRERGVPISEDAPRRFQVRCRPMRS